MGVVLCGRLPFGIRAGVTLRKKTVEAPYSKVGEHRAPRMFFHRLLKGFRPVVYSSREILLF